jgi:hypothetical protein
VEGTAEVMEVMACKKCAFELSTKSILSVTGHGTKLNGLTLVDGTVTH